MSLSLPGVLSSERLPNGLEVHLLKSADAPVVTTALTYRVGARHEPPGRSGLAHFLEHMMFKGSEAYGPGEIDRRTLALGGGNNAFTSHDTTTYYFSFGAEKWAEALRIEADRMRGLRYLPEEIERERSVIFEELAMYEAEPWDALERRVHSTLFGEHPYGRPIIGKAEEVARISRSDLEGFHRRFYRPDNGVLVVAGAIDDTALETVGERFGRLEPEPVADGEPTGGSAPGQPVGGVRIEIARGRVPRLLLALPAPAADHPDFPALRLLCALLACGRSGRLNERLVERESLCGWVSASVSEGSYGGVLQIAAELTPGTEAAKVEAIVLGELERLRRGEAEERGGEEGASDEPSGEAGARGIADEALARARRMLEADWVFAHERIEVQALTLSQSAALFGPHYPAEQLAAVARVESGELVRVAERYLDPGRGSVLGWALPEAD